MKISSRVDNRIRSLLYKLELKEKQMEKHIINAANYEVWLYFFEIVSFKTK